MGGIGRLRRPGAAAARSMVRCATAARIRAEAVHLCAGLRARLHAGECPRRHPVELSDRRSRASSTARATMTGDSAVRCSRAPRWPVPRTSRPWRWRPSWACPNLLRFLGRAGLEDPRQDIFALRPGPDARQCRSPPRRARRAPTRRSRGAASGSSRLMWPATLHACEPPASSRRARRSGSPTSCPIRTPASIAFGRGGSLEFPFPVAVKTGTSQAYHDNWTVGYSKHVTVGVWVGNFDRTPLRNSSGVTGAAPIFQGVMLAAERRAAGGAIDFGSGSILSPDASSTRREICALSGQLANAWCPNRRHEWTASEASDVPCSWHHDSDEGLQTILPAEYQAWQTGPREDVRGADCDVRCHVRTCEVRSRAKALRRRKPGEVGDRRSSRRSDLPD